jgi:hypothetical protein
MPPEEFDFETILKVLAGFDVDFIVVGGLCAVLHGAPIQTYDLDIVHSRDSVNLERLENALRELGAYYREHRHRRLLPEAARMATPGHPLLPHTVELALDETLWIRILDLATLIVTKQEAGREKDKLVLPILRRTLEEINRGRSGQA